MTIIIENPNISSLVHCFTKPDKSVVFGSLVENHMYSIRNKDDFEEFFEEPWCHAAFVFCINKQKSDSLYKALASSDFIEFINDSEKQVLVCAYTNLCSDNDLIILLETLDSNVNPSSTYSAEYLSDVSYFGEKHYYIPFFYITYEMLIKKDTSFFKSLDSNDDVFNMFVKISMDS